MTARRLSRVAAAATIAILGGVVMIGGVGSAVAARGSSGSQGFSASKTLIRNYVEDGVTTQVDKRHFSVHVNETNDLRNRQEINVSWHGAHPTGGIQPDPTSQAASGEEYPVVIMMCRGSASASAPAKDRVSQKTCWTATPPERSQSDGNFTFPPYRVDADASVADRAQLVGLPSPLPKACKTFNLDGGAAHWVPFVGADGKRYGYGPQGCAGLPPEAAVTDASQPSNTVYGVSDSKGKGSSNFVITTNESNASLGCSDKVPCSLAIVPIIGVSCDPAAFGLPAQDQPQTPAAEKQATDDCETNGNYTPGQLGGTLGTEAPAVSGQLWWSASNWRNRILVPLNFAAPDDVCSLVSTASAMYIYGSPVLTQAMAQWAPYFCTGKSGLNFNHVITSEPEAKNLLAAGSIHAAFQGVPPQVPFKQRTVQAPTAVSGFTVVYAIDEPDGTKYLHLRLDARLLAKLLTESYPGDPTFQAQDKQLKNNPLDLAADPEFQALNPGAPADIHATDAASTILTLSADSDVTWALTSYINSDPEARAWLNGKPDPWGMKVNPAYKNIALPVTSFPLLDTTIPQGFYDNNQCLSGAPVPWLPLIATPVENQATITLDMQYDISNAQINCQTSPVLQLKPYGRETNGQRFLLGITSIADARRYSLTPASLQTSGGSTGSSKFKTAKGRTFVAPTDAGLRAGAKLLKWNPSEKSWVLPYADLHATAGHAAYPGTMLLSTDVPTSGLGAPAAKAYAAFLTFAAGRGQRPGFGNGDLPPGFLPLTAANGLGNEVAYTRAAAIAVKSQDSETPNELGKLPSTGKVTPPGGGSSPSPGPGSGSNVDPNTGTNTLPGVTSPGDNSLPTPASSGSPTVASNPPPTAAVQVTGVLAADGIVAKAFPIAALIALLSALGIGAFWAVSRRAAP